MANDGKAIPTPGPLCVKILEVQLYSLQTSFLVFDFPTQIYKLKFSEAQKIIGNLPRNQVN